MMNRTLILTPMLALFVALGGCEAAEPFGPSAEEHSVDALDNLLAQASASHPADSDDSAGGGDAGRAADAGRGGNLLDRLAAEIPGFGGLYRTRQCMIVAVLTPAADAQHAIRVVHAAVAPLAGRPCADGFRVSAERGQFTYLELKRYQAASRPLLEIPGLHAIRIDFKANRLVYSVASRDVAQAVLDALPRLGIPARAVSFELGGRRP